MVASCIRMLPALAAAAAFGFGTVHAEAASGESLVCCKADTGWKIRNPLKLGSRTRPYRMVPATECTKEKGRVVIGTHHCQSACRKRGGDWVWRNNRCRRPEVRDRRSFRELQSECLRRGKGWVWKNRRCQRVALRDKRTRTRMICCRIDVTRGIGAKLLDATLGYGDYRFGMMPDAECRTNTRQIVSTYLCVKACERAGKDWVWKDNRCRRASVRDKRGR